MHGLYAIHLTAVPINHKHPQNVMLDTNLEICMHIALLYKAELLWHCLAEILDIAL